MLVSVFIGSGNFPAIGSSLCPLFVQSRFRFAADFGLGRKHQLRDTSQTCSSFLKIEVDLLPAHLWFLGQQADLSTVEELSKGGLPSSVP